MSPPLENEYCELLSNEENLHVFKLLGNRCQSLCTTVVQLFYTYPPLHSEWLKKGTGVLCFVKDNAKKNFFFRLFCLRRGIKLWEQEMYSNMEYIEATSFFHMFEAHDCIVAFNFVSKEEARNLKIVVSQKIHARKRREEKRSRQINHSQTIPGPTVDFSGFKKNPDPTATLAKRKRNITKADISTPMDFKHISHVGWNSTSGFDVETEDEELKAFFKKAGVSEQQLQDKSTREFLYDFVNTHGGRDAVIKGITVTDTPPPAVPPRGPIRGSHLRNAPPSSSSPKKRPKPPAEITHHKKPAPTPTPSSIPGSAPPAPPPPPPPPPLPPLNEPSELTTVSSAPPPPPPPVVDANSALLQSIRDGTTLKPVEERKIAPQEDARSDLLSEIRKGCKLKPVEERDVKPISNPPPEQGGAIDLSTALKRALAERSIAIHSEDDDDDTTDDEWED
ncbi:hypothetical protein NQ315_004782 [Exocentrus adspersus]|uniref:Neural Wiskott-Aldrich syndrome protein n=1 Tax=Exocentrus adspersus TaxID=1586481 RepID=A0AAV8W2F7_9CUCU|nr:hypothetical protein NQ315_004782 [Exocentrus adspersus]